MARIDSDLARAYLWWRQTNPRYPAAGCLIKAHLDVAKGKRRYPNSASHVYHGTWQPDGRRYFCDNFPAGWRELGTAAEVCQSEHSRRVDHDGWYTDSFQDGTMQGYVLQLPARRGVPQYVPATAHSDWDGVTLYLHDICDDKLDAAQFADRHAEIMAEESRDYDGAFQAGRDAGSKMDDIDRLRTIALRACDHFRKAMDELGFMSGFDVTRMTLREDKRRAVRDAWEQICELRDDIERLRCEVPASLMFAFDEGFGS